MSPWPRVHRGWGRGAVLGLLLLAIPVAAEAVVLWYQHYERGLELAEAAQWRPALEEFEAAAAAEPRPRRQIRTYGSRFIFDYDPFYQQARCLVELGRAEDAAGRLAAAEDAGVTPAAELADLRRRLEVLLAAGSSPGRPSQPSAPPPPEPALLAVESTPSGAVVTVDGRGLGRTPLAGLQVTSGSHRVQLAAPGFEVWEQEVVSTSGELLRLDVALRPRPAAPAAVPPSELEVSPPSSLRAVLDRETPAVDRPAGAATELERGASTAPVVDAGQREPARPETAENGGSPSAEPSEGEEGASPGGPDSTAGAATEPEPSPPVAAEVGSAASGGEVAAPEAGPKSIPLVALGVLSALLAAVLGVVLYRRQAAARRLAAGAPALPFQRLGGYRILEELGRGGMATTYRARRLADGKIVALKIPHQTGDPTYLQRFLQEGRLGETLHHPGIVRIFEAGEDRGVAFLAMELVPGRQLKQEIESSPQGLPLERALEFTHAIAEALDYAHSKGVVHRDLKPENIMLLPDGSLKVMDFGVARIDGQPGLTTSQFFFGSPLYAAPELIEQPRTVDRRVDLYSLGVLLFELLEGHPPFVHESIFKLLEMHQKQPLPAAGSLPRALPPEVWAVLRRLLEKDPDRRYGSAQELLVDLKRLLYGPGEEGGRQATG